MRLKVNSILVTLSLSAITLIITQLAHAKEGGAPSGNTGSPGDGQTCAHVDCHTGGSTAVEGIISSDIPESGYLAGEVYTVTVTINSPGTVKFGFQCSPQNPDGDLLGNMDIINASQTKLTGAGKYITHTSTGTNGADLKSWTFNWTSDDATGDVTFYVAINIANNDDHASGDSICTSLLTVREDTANIPLSISNSDIHFEMQNPASQQIVMHYETALMQPVQLEIIDMNGTIRLTAILNEPSGQFSYNVSELPTGMYFVRLRQGEKKSVQKLMITR